LLFFTIDSPLPNLERLMNEYGTGLTRLCYLYLKDHHLAQDAVQETFIKVYAKYSSFRSESSEKTWITRIAMNVCRDMMRRRSYRERPEEFDDYMAVSAEGTPEDSAVDRDENIALLHAIRALPDIYRETILLYYYQGFSAQEISAILHTAKSTVNVRLKRGRDMLRTALSDDEI
jgi:RNA polymerase sigma-70 factor (ECF subfamily)